MLETGGTAVLDELGSFSVASSLAHVAAWHIVF